MILRNILFKQQFVHTKNTTLASLSKKKLPKICRKNIFQKKVMVTNENYNFAIYSIMITTDFSKKEKKKVF